MLLTENWEGKVHGLNLRYINAAYARQLYWFFTLPAQQQQQMMPLDQEFKEEQQKTIAQKYQEYKQQLLQQQTGVIVRPIQSIGQKNTFGVSTWQHTQKQTVPAQQPVTPQQKKELEALARQEAQQEQQKQKQTEMEYLKRQAQMRDYIGNPYIFYHKYLKPLFGGAKGISTCYRKYDPRYIKSPRLVRGLENLYIGIQK